MNQKVQKDQNPAFWISQQISGYQLKCEFSKGHSRDSFFAIQQIYLFHSNVFF